MINTLYHSTDSRKENSSEIGNLSPTASNMLRTLFNELGYQYVYGDINKAGSTSIQLVKGNKEIAINVNGNDSIHTVRQKLNSL